MVYSPEKMKTLKLMYDPQSWNHRLGILHLLPLRHRWWAYEKGRATMIFAPAPFQFSRLAPINGREVQFALGMRGVFGLTCTHIWEGERALVESSKVAIRPEDAIDSGWEPDL